MDIVVLMKHVPDLVEELEVDPDTGQLDRMFLRLVPNEMDEHALEQALLLKERHGGTVTVLTLDTGDVDETLYTALAKGADKAAKIVGTGMEDGVTSRGAAKLFEQALADEPYDLILTGTQAVDELDGSVGSLLAARKDLPFVGYVTAIQAASGSVRVHKEYPGGLRAEMEMRLPAVVGIQAAEKPPRYVVTSLVMDAMKAATLGELEIEPEEPSGQAEVRMQLPEPATRANMLEGDAEAVADALLALLRERGVLATEGGAS